MLRSHNSVPCDVPLNHYFDQTQQFGPSICCKVRHELQNNLMETVLRWNLLWFFHLPDPVRYCEYLIGAITDIIVEGLWHDDTGGN